jgi:hypothetical protein
MMMAEYQKNKVGFSEGVVESRLLCFFWTKKKKQFQSHKTWKPSAQLV